MSDRDPATCFHESGHATVARLLGFPAGRASAIDATGYALVYHPKHAPVSERLMVHLAGGEAEHHFWGSNGHDTVDRQRALALARRHGLDADHVERVRRQTRIIIDQYWPIVRAIALALKNSPQGWLSGRKLDQIFASKMAAMQKGD